MIKIDLTDKFIHSPNCFDNHNKEALKRFRNILKSGYLLIPKESGIKTNHYYDDKIFFAVHPYGKFSKYYPEKGLACFSNTDGYQMASRGIFFILNSKLREDYDLQPVTYKYECATNNNVDLYKYLEGIGNAGLNIDDKLIYSYYFIKYANNEIPASKVIEIVKERNLDVDLIMALKSISKSINSMFLKEYNYLNIVLSKSAENLLNNGNYYQIVNILNEENKKIELYDKYGYSINPKNRLKEVNEMYKYLENNRTIQMDDAYFTKIKELSKIASN